MSLAWSDLYRLIRKYSLSDTLIILDCCIAGAAMHEDLLDVRESNARTIELIVACGAKEFSGTFGVRKSFHHAFITTLKTLSMKWKPFSAVDLTREIALQVRRWETQQLFAEQKRRLLKPSPPIHFMLNKGLEGQKILLKPQKSKTQTPVKRDARIESAWERTAAVGCFAGWRLVCANGGNIPWWLRRHDPHENL
jgi:hypothetical protein